MNSLFEKERNLYYRSSSKCEWLHFDHSSYIPLVAYLISHLKPPKKLLFGPSSWKQAFDWIMIWGFPNGKPTNGLFALEFCKFVNLYCKNFWFSMLFPRKYFVVCRFLLPVRSSRLTSLGETWIVRWNRHHMYT